MMAKKKDDPRTLVLIDAHAIIHRAYHALPDFSSSKGEPTGALFGLSTMLMKIIQELNPDYIAACYDLPEPTHRHEVFAEYKDGRKKSEPELVTQLEKSRTVFEAFGVPLYDARGFEADDVLATIVEQLKDTKQLRIIIASGDMDTLQLVDDDRVLVYTLRKGIQDTVLYDEDAVRARFGFGPELLPDYKGLCGDPSDNIPGIRGIGEKSATELITQFGGMDDMYAALEASEGAAVFEEKGIKKRIIGLLQEGKDEAFFSKMLATVRRDAPVDYAIPESVWRETIDPDAVLTLFADLEFRTLHDRLKRLLNIETDAVSEQHEEEEDVSDEEVRRTAIALWLIRSDITSPTKDDILQFAGTKRFADARAAVFTTLKERNLERVFTEIEEPLIPVVARMNETGVGLDTAYLTKLSKEYHTELERIETQVFASAGTTFNINSPKQLAEVLFDTLELKPKNQKKTATGQRSTRESELEKLRGEHPIIEHILAYRELQKLVSTYVDALPAAVGDDGRLHAEFLQAGTTTGRMASQHPNLQNIPIKSAYGRRIRNAFVAEKRHELVALDYSQIELRIAAILSEDAKLMHAFEQGHDIHTAVAADVFGVSVDAVDKEMRRKAKVINFGILYGMGVNALRGNLGADTTQKEARAFYDAYFATYTGLAQWIDHTKADASRLGYTQTLFGRRRYFDGITSHLPHIRAAAERMAINAPIQGTSADIIKLAMIRIDEHIAAAGLRDHARLVLQVHDELIYEVHTDHVAALTPTLRSYMQEVLPDEQRKGVPLDVDVSRGKNWGEMEKVTTA